jgi:hypothetical protein
MTSGLSPRTLALSIVLPLLILLGGWGLLRRPAAVSEEVWAFDRQLAVHEPEVIVFGSSLANRGVDLPVLARGLGLPENKILLMQLPHSSLAHWYAMLKNRVFANGHRPKLVLVVDAFTSMLHHDLLHDMEPNVERLMEHMTPNEPVLAEKVFQSDDPEQFRDYVVRLRANAWRDGLLDRWRDLVLGTFFTRKGKPEELEKLVERVNDDVFANDKMNYDLHKQKLEEQIERGAPTSTSNIPYSDEDWDLRRHALLPDMAELANEYGANLFFVRIPLPPSNTDMDFVPPEVETEAVDWIESLHAVYLDMRGLDLDDGMFEDMRHLSNRGAELFTSALARVLSAMHALEPGASDRAIQSLERPQSVAVDGRTLAAPSLDGAKRSADGCRVEVDAGPFASLSWARLSSLAGREAEAGVPSPLRVTEAGVALAHRQGGPGCTGSAWIEGGKLIISPTTPGAAVEVVLDWDSPDPSDPTGKPLRWVAPGTTVTMTFADPWTLPDNAFRVYARGQGVGDGQGAVTVSVQDETFTLANRAGRLSGSSRLRAPREAGWALRVAVPSDGPWLLLHHLAIGAPPSTAFLIGRAETLHGSSVRIVGGRVEDTQVKATYLADPVVVPLVPRLRRGGRGTGAFDLRTLIDLSDSEERDDLRPNQCSPLRVLEDGVPLTGAHAPCSDVIALGEGRSCFASGIFIFASSDGSDPVLNGRSYSLALTPRRVCDVMGQKNAAFLRDSWWLYPEDVAEFQIGAPSLGAFRDGANVLEVEVMPHVAPLAEPLQIVVTADGQTVLDQRWQPEGTMKRRRIAWPLSPPLPVGTRELVVRFTNPNDKSFALLTSVTLAEEYDMFAEQVAKVATVADGTPSVAIEARAERTGQVLLELDPKRGTMTQQGAVEIKVFPLWPISDSYLEKIGLAPASPIAVSVDGRAFTHEPDRKAFRGGCTDCFYHSGQSILLYGEKLKKQIEPAISLASALPGRAMDGSETWWVYPGTTLTWSLPKALPAGSTVVVEGLAFHPQKEMVGSGLFLAAGGGEAPLARGAGEGVALVELAAGAPVTTIALRSEAPGGFFLVRRLRVQSPAGVGWVVQQPMPDGGKAVGDAE